MTAGEAAEDRLRTVLEAHTDVYAVIQHVSRSGMQRRIDFYVIESQAEGHSGKTHMRCISRLVAEVLSLRMHPQGGVVINGGGMDMGWDAIYSCRLALGLGETRDDQTVAFGALGHVPGYGFYLRYL